MLPTIPQLSIDAIIIIALLLTTAYGVVAGMSALMREAISIYVGLVLAAAFGGPLYDLSMQGASGNLPFSKTVVQLALLILPIAILQFGPHRAHAKHPSSIIVVLFLAVATAMLLISSVLQQFNAVSLSRITEQSNLAAQIYKFRLVWLAAVPLVIGVSALFERKSKHNHK